MRISLIAAISNNYAIGKNNALPWHLPNDLKLFKSLTSKQVVIMGRKTFDSIGKPLPNRQNIVLTKNQNKCNSLNSQNIMTASSLIEAISLVKEYKEIFIIGGERVFNEGINIASKLYITKVDAIISNADAFFPKISDKIWAPKLKESFKADESHKYNYSFWEYERN